MTTQPSEYDRPPDWPSALAALNKPGRSSSPLTLPPRVPDDRFAGVEAVVDLSRLDLAAIRQTEDRIELGALVPLQDLATAPWREDAAGSLVQAAHLAAHPGLRHLATVGGVLCPGQSGPPEVLLALLALDASVVFYGPGQVKHEMPLADFLAQTGGATSEVVANVSFARLAAGAAGGLARVARTPRDEAIVAAAAALVVADGVCRQARLGLSGAGVIPQRVRAAEAMLEGQPLSAERIRQAAAAAPAGLAFISDLRGSAAYRHAMATVVARRSLTAAWQTATRA